jgi:hypothetical protein
VSPRTARPHPPWGALLAESYLAPPKTTPAAFLLKQKAASLILSTGRPSPEQFKDTLSHQDTKSLLLEMPIRSQNLGERHFLHSLHSNAVGQAIILVAAPLVEVESFEESFPGLGHDSDVRMLEKPSRERRRTRPHQRPARGKGGEELRQNLVHREETYSPKP